MKERNGRGDLHQPKKISDRTRASGGESQLVERTELIRRRVHQRYLPRLIKLLIILAITFSALDLSLILFFGGSIDVLVVIVAVEAIIVATLIGIWTSLFNAEVVSVTSADVALVMETKADELLRQSRTELDTIASEQRKYIHDIVSALRDRGAEEIRILKEVASSLDALNQTIGSQSEALSKLEEAEHERTKVLQEAQQRQIQVAEQQIDLTIRQAQPILDLRIWADGIIRQAMKLSISPRANDVRNIVINITAQRTGDTLTWKKQETYIPAGSAKVWNLGDVGQFPSPGETPMIFSINYEDRFGTQYHWEPRAAIRRWGILGKGFRADFV